MAAPAIVPAVPEDAGAILALQRLAFAREAALYEDQSIAPLVETEADILRRMGVGCLLAAKLDGALVGAVHGSMDGPECHVARLMVHPDMQGRGLGAELMLAIEAHFTKAAAYCLFTGHRSAGNLKLYTRLGYREVRREPVNDRLTFVHMRKP